LPPKRMVSGALRVVKAEWGRNMAGYDGEADNEAELMTGEVSKDGQLVQATEEGEKNSPRSLRPEWLGRAEVCKKGGQRHAQQGRGGTVTNAGIGNVAALGLLSGAPEPVLEADVVEAFADELRWKVGIGVSR
jgi:hypothetical protein